MWQRGEQKELSSPFLELKPEVVRGESRFLKWRVFRERKCNFSLDFPVFGQSDLVGQEAKLFYAAKATRGHRFCGVLTTPRGRGLLLLGYFQFYELCK